MAPSTCNLAGGDRLQGKACESAARTQWSVFLLRMLTMMMLLFLTGSVSGSPGVRFECFDDLCISRFQYCSQTQHRCQYCRKEHCLDSTFTPAQCQPLCPELFTTHLPVEATSDSYRSTSNARVLQSFGSIQISLESLLTVTVVLIIVIIFLQIVVLVLGISLCKYAIPVYKNLLRLRVPTRETTPLEEDEILLNGVRPDLRPAKG